MKFLNWLITGKTKNPFLLGINERNRKLIYTNNKRKYYELADDKILSKEILEAQNIPCAKTYTVIDRIGNIEKSWAEMQKYSSLAIKPSKGSGGGGILVLHKKGTEWYKGKTQMKTAEILLHMAKIIMGQYSLNSTDRVLIEECIISHSFFGEIYPDGVPDLRVILLKGEILMAMLRLPTKESGGKANLHQGGLGVGIDAESGMLLKAFDGDKYHDVHPDSGSKIHGLQVPYWKEIIGMSIKTSKHFPLNYLGVDIVLDQDKGPLIMEVNVRPGLGIQLANQWGLNKAIKS